MFYDAQWDFCAHDKQAVLPPLACQNVVEIMNFYVAEVIMPWRKGGNFSPLHFSVIVQSQSIVVVWLILKVQRWF